MDSQVADQKNQEEQMSKKPLTTGNGLHGQHYQLNLLVLFQLRGVQLKYHQFQLRSEVPEAGKFDDLMFKYQKNGKTYYKLLQAKHNNKTDKTAIDYGTLFEQQSKDFKLVRYLIPYLKYKEQIKDGEIEDVIICTIKNMNVKKLKRKDIEVEEIADKDDILDFESEKGAKRYRFTNIVPKLKKQLKEYKNLAGKYTENDIKDFVNHLVLAVSQPDEQKLKTLIKQEISKTYKLMNPDEIYHKLLDIASDMMKGHRVDVCFDEVENILKKARKSFQPILFGVRNPVKSFEGRQEQLIKIHETLKNKKIAAICGLGGVGKSELCRKYIYTYGEYFESIIWLNAETDKTLSDSFKSLAADKLGIGIKNADKDQVKDIKVIVEDVYKFFSDKLSLFVFDNAISYGNENGIKYFLPDLSQNYNEPYILLTSQNRKWPDDVKVLELNGLAENEAFTLISKAFMNDNSESDVKELSKELDYVPLAIQQAIAYIKVTDKSLRNVGKTFSIKNFLEKFNREPKILLDYKFDDTSDSDYSKTILITWNVTFDAIKKREQGDTAIKILNNLADFGYNAPVNEMLSIEHDVEALGHALELLKQYSMITIDNGWIRAHNLVKHVVPLIFSENEQKKDIWFTLFKYVLILKPLLSSENVFMNAIFYLIFAILILACLFLHWKQNGRFENLFEKLFDYTKLDKLLKKFGMCSIDY